MSYRNYLNKSLNFIDLSHVNSSAPEDLKYCNFICQEYVSKDEFTNRKNGNSVICKKCQNLYNLAIKQINDKSITLDQFKENPHIVLGQDVISISTKECSNCKQNKSVDCFEYGRTKCKECRTIESTDRNSNITSYIQDIENKKNNIGELRKYLELVPKDKLIKCISHFSVGRKSTDTKATMVNNTVSHFEKILDTWMCRGSCGNRLTEQFSTCEGCKRVKARTKITLEDFKIKILPDLIKELKNIKYEDDHKYNRLEVSIWAKELGLSERQKMTKEEVVEMINEEVEKRIRDRDNLLNGIIDDEPKEKNIELNGFVVSSREDGFINATQMCKAGNKKFNDWSRLESTKELIKELEELLKSDTDLPVSQLIEIKKGNSCKFAQGSWIHPDLAVQLAQWISPKFAIQVSRWVRELAITGSVSVGSDKNNKQLLELQKKNIEIKEDYKKLENKHNKILKKRNYYKFKKGDSFYIISDIECGVLRNKPGVEGENIDNRLRTHRTSFPACKLEFLCYSNDCKLIEENMLKRYEKFRKYLNHEWCYEIDVKHMIESVKTIIDFLGLEVEIETNIDKYNEQIEI
jgi:hypothetical protein